MQHIPSEKIISYDGVIELNLGELNLYYNELGLNSFPKENRHDRNWSNASRQYWPVYFSHHTDYILTYRE